MTLRHTVKGFTLIEVLIALTMLGAIGLTGAKYYSETYVPNQRAGITAEEIKTVKSAAVAYHLEFNRWPANVAELRDLGFYQGPVTSNTGGAYQLSQTAEGHLAVTVDTGSVSIANRAAGRMDFAEVAGATLTSLEGVPSREIVQTYFLARKLVDGCPECNTMETAIDMAGNDIKNINEFDAQLARIEEAIIDVATVQSLEDVESLKIGSSELTASGNTLVIDAEETRLTGGLSLGGSLDAGGNDINNAGTINANEVVAGVGRLDDVSGINLNYVNGTVDILSGQDINYVTGEIRALSGVQLNYQTGEIASLSGTSLNYNTASLSSVSGNTLSYGNGTIGALGGNSLNYVSGTIGTLGGTALNYGSGTIGSLTGNSLSYNTVSANSFLGGGGKLSSLEVTGHTTLATVQSTAHTTQTLTANLQELVTLNISNTLTTNKLISSDSKLGTASASSLAVSGQATAGSVQSNTFTAQSGSIKTLTGTTFTYNTVNANTFNGGVFNGSNFITPSTSTNYNRQLADQLLAQWNSCKSAGGCQ
jgi:prepilin-type N-terminal cleavage/methylation domain-containing protein